MEFHGKNVDGVNCLEFVHFMHRYFWSPLKMHRAKKFYMDMVGVILKH